MRFWDEVLLFLKKINGVLLKPTDLLISSRYELDEENEPGLEELTQDRPTMFKRAISRRGQVTCGDMIDLHNPG
jgi:hypothetical protein